MLPFAPIRGAQLEVGDEGALALLDEDGIVGDEADEVDGVQEDGADVRGFGFLAEGGGFFVGVGAAAPHLRRAAEYLDGLGAHGLRAVDGLVEAAGGGDVRADPHGPSSLPATASADFAQIFGESARNA